MLIVPAARFVSSRRGIESRRKQGEAQTTQADARRRCAKNRSSTFLCQRSLLTQGRLLLCISQVSQVRTQLMTQQFSFLPIGLMFPGSVSAVIASGTDNSTNVCVTFPLSTKANTKYGNATFSIIAYHQRRTLFSFVQFFLLITSAQHSIPKRIS